MNLDPRESPWLLADAVITMGVLLLVFGAFDDITTDNATAFPLEYSALTLCAAWLLGLAVRLVRHGRPAIGAVSFLALGAAAWGQRAIGPGGLPPSNPHSIAVLGAFAWFLVLSLVLLVVGWRSYPENVTERTG